MALLEEIRRQEKQQLAKALMDMQMEVKENARRVNMDIEQSVLKIQRAARVMLSRKRFKVALYKMVLLKNIVENKVHKEKMAMLFAFEQLIINTEDPNEEAGEYYYDEQDFEG